MARLVLINGAPGVGKSTLAQRLAQTRPMSLALDIDAIRYAIGGWQEQMPASGLAACRLAAAMAAEHLSSGHNVIVSQYLGQVVFISELESLARKVGAEWHEIVLEIDAEALAERLRKRRLTPDRTEHVINNGLAGPEDAPSFVDSMKALLLKRPAAVRIDASGDAEETLRKTEDALAAGGDDARSH